MSKRQLTMGDWLNAGIVNTILFDSKYGASSFFDEGQIELLDGGLAGFFFRDDLDYINEVILARPSVYEQVGLFNRVVKEQEFNCFYDDEDVELISYDEWRDSRQGNIDELDGNKQIYFGYRDDRMILDKMGLFAFSLFYLQVFGINIMEDMFAYCKFDIEFISKTMYIGSDLRAVLVSLYHMGKEYVKDRIVDEEMSVVLNSDLRETEYMSIDSQCAATQYWEGKTYYQGRYGLANYFRLLRSANIRMLHTKLEYDGTEDTHIYHMWFMKKPEIILVRTAIAYACMHSVRSSFYRHLSQVGDGANVGFEKFLIGFNQYLKRQEKPYLITVLDIVEDFHISDLIYKPYMDTMLNYYGENVYTEGKQAYMEHIEKQMVSNPDIEDSGNVMIELSNMSIYEQKREIYDTAPVKRSVRDKDRELFKGSVKNLYSFLIPILDHPEEYRECSTVYFVGCGSSEWYSRLGELLIDKQIVFIDTERIIVNPASINSTYWMGDFREYDFLPNSYVYFDVFSVDDPFLIYEDIKTLLNNKRFLLYSNKIMTKMLEKAGKKEINVIGRMMVLPYGKMGSYELRSYGTRYSDDTSYRISYLMKYIGLYNWSRLIGSICIDCDISRCVLSRMVSLPAYYRRMLISKGIEGIDRFQIYRQMRCHHGYGDGKLNYFELNDVDLCCFYKNYWGNQDLSSYYYYLNVLRKDPSQVKHLTKYQKKMVLTWCMCDPKYDELLMQDLSS